MLFSIEMSLLFLQEWYGKGKLNSRMSHRRKQYFGLRQRTLLLLVLLFANGCTTRPLPQPSSATVRTTTMPPSHYTAYYSSQKARALGETYADNLDHLLNQLTQSSIGKLQSTNAVVALSLGFFTHSASQPADERYLEAIIGMPDILEEEKDFTTQIRQLFSQYGAEVLSTLARDEVIVRDPKIAGYGLHFAWRNLRKTPSGPHLTMREAVMYLSKNQTQQFLSQQITQEMLLQHATLFSRQGERPAEPMQYNVSTPGGSPLTVTQTQDEGPVLSPLSTEQPVAPMTFASPTVDLILPPLVEQPPSEASLSNDP